MNLIPKLILVLLLIGMLFSLLSFSAQFGDVITGNVVKVSESTPLTLISFSVLVLVFLIIALVIIGILSLSKED